MRHWHFAISNLPNQFVLALLISSLLAAPPRASGEIKDTPEGRQWKVKCDKGVDGISPGTRLKLTVGPQKVTVTVRGITKKQDKVALVIPASEIVTFAHYTRESGSAEGWNNFWSGFDPSAASDPQGALAGLAVVSVLAGISGILEQVKQTEHLMVLFWHGADGEKSIVVRIGKDEHEPLLSELRQSTGHAWRDVAAESNQVAQEIQQSQDKIRTTSVDFDREAKLPGSNLRLPPGRYQLVLLERESDLGELYVYSRPDTKPEHFVGRSVVEIRDRAAGTAPSPVTYSEEDGRAVISMVQFEDKALSLVATPRTPATTAVPAATAGYKVAPPQTLGSWKTLAITSKTVWFKPRRLQEALQNSADFNRSGILLVSDEKQADILLQINRPLFTFDWTYVITHRESGAKLGEGKINAWDDKAAAPRLAADAWPRLLALHPPPAPAPQGPLPAQEENTAPWAMP